MRSFLIVKGFLTWIRELRKGLEKEGHGKKGGGENFCFLRRGTLIIGGGCKKKKGIYL